MKAAVFAEKQRQIVEAVHIGDQIRLRRRLDLLLACIVRNVTEGRGGGQHR